MKLVITEKPSVAQSVTKVIGAKKRCDGYLEGGGYVVSWCVGHLVELSPPQAYDERYGKWRYEDLPILPVKWRYEVLPSTKKQHEIRFITSHYDELFRIPDGGLIEVDYPDRKFCVKCEYLDDYHTRIGLEVFHICQFAEILERGGGTCRLEPELLADEAAWQIGYKNYLALQRCEDGWDYTLFDPQLEAEIFNSKIMKRCSVCGKPFYPNSNRGKYCKECGERMKRIKATERKRRQRASVTH